VTTECTFTIDVAGNNNSKFLGLEQFPDPDWHPKVTNLQEMIDFIKVNSKQPKF
jgi:hypothetical protein